MTHAGLVLPRFGGGWLRDTFRKMGGFKGQWATITQGRMQPLTIIKHFNELKHSGSSNPMGGKALQLGEFSTQGTKETLHHGIVIGVALAAHADLNAMCFQQCQILV